MVCSGGARFQTGWLGKSRSPGDSTPYTCYRVKIVGPRIRGALARRTIRLRHLQQTFESGRFVRREALGSYCPQVRQSPRKIGRLQVQVPRRGHEGLRLRGQGRLVQRRGNADRDRACEIGTQHADDPSRCGTESQFSHKGLS